MKIITPRTRQPATLVGVNPGWSYAKDLIFAAAGRMPDAVTGIAPLPIGSGQFGYSLDGHSLESFSTSADGYYYALPSNHPLYSITNNVTYIGIFEIDAWVGFSSAISVPYAAGSWANPFGAFGVQQDSASGALRMWGSGNSNNGNGTAILPMGRNVVGISRVVEQYYFNVNGATQSIASAFPGGTFDFTNKQPLCILQRSDSSVGESIDGRSSLTLLLKRGLNPSELADAINTCWQAFAPTSRRLWAPAAAVGTFNPAFANQNGQFIGAGAL